MPHACACCSGGLPARSRTPKQQRSIALAARRQSNQKVNLQLAVPKTMAPPTTAGQATPSRAAAETKTKKLAANRNSKKQTATVGVAIHFAVGLAVVIMATIAPAAAQFLAPADPACDLSTIPTMFAEISAACPDYAELVCLPECALAMAPAAYGSCTKTITGIIDQSEGGEPDGVAQTLLRQFTACTVSNTPADLAAAASAAQGCAPAGASPTPAGGGHRLLIGDLITLGNVTDTRHFNGSSAVGSRRRAQASEAQVQQIEELLAAVAAADGSVCRVVDRLTAALVQPPGPAGVEGCDRECAAAALVTFAASAASGVPAAMQDGGCTAV